MSFWVREIVGWLLLILGLAVFALCLLVLFSPAPRLLEAGPMVLIGIFVFRGGLHFLKVSVAARVALRAQQLAQSQQSSAATMSRSVSPFERQRIGARNDR